ncbi:IAP-like protein 1 [Perilla frutescens var. hirtella]|nr:IAP-like protein 1 [Perilla frutescens var. frutescens]KAH6775510.1 IAP-like protein 1 [Perilla frutescens var. hirtella]
MKDEAVSSSRDPLLPPRSSSPPPSLTPAASSAGASSPAVPTNAGSSDGIGQGQNSKGGSLSRIGSQPMRTSLSTSAGGSALGSSQPSCRPWERGDLLRRLSTFKPANWFGKPKAASSLACARKGWVNVDVDKVECESCGAILKFVSSATWTPSEADTAGEEFSKRLDEGHKVTCPWIGNCCAESLVQFPPTPPSALIGGYKDRCDGLLQFSSLPVVAASAIEQMRISRGSEIDRLLAQSQLARSESGIKLEILLGTESSREDVFFIYSRAQKLISLCGWEPRWLPNVQDCEEHSAQSARNGCSIGPSKYRAPPRDPSRGKKALSSSTKRDYGGTEVIGTNSKGVSRSPLLDCSLCGATVRIWDFLTVPRPSSFVPSSTEGPETNKKMALTRGISAASGISGWVAADGTEKEQAEDPDEAATGEGKSLSNVGVDLNLTMSAGLSSSRLNMNVTSEQYQYGHRGRDLLIGQPSSSEVGDRAASYESRGPSSRKRNLDEGGSTVDRPHLLLQQADSGEGTVIDRDGDEVDDGGQYSAGPSKRARDSGVVEPRRSPYRKDSSGAGPSRSFGFDIGIDAYRDEFDQGNEQVIGNPSTRDSTHVSSVIAMDTICHSADNDSMESVENYPGNFDDIHLPSTSGIKNTDPVETSELNYSNQAQQSTCPAAVRSTGEIGVSSTNEEEVVNTDTFTAHGRDGPSLGISGGSVGMGASHEAEIHGIDASIYRTDSVVGDVEPITEITDNQGQTGEFAPDPGMGDFVPEEVDREDPHGDSQDLMSRSVVRADSGSKVMGSTKAESVESGEKTSNMRATSCENSPHPSLSCNAILYSGIELSKEEVTQAAKDLTTDDCGFVESGYQVANGSGPPNGGSNYDEPVEFDPIKHHNLFCPWVNGNVAAAGCSSSGGSGSSASATALALCGWQLTIDALDAFQLQGQVPVQTVESESAASMYKDDHNTPGRKLLARHSFNKSRGKN